MYIYVYIIPINKIKQSYAHIYIHSYIPAHTFTTDPYHPLLNNIYAFFINSAHILYFGIIRRITTVEILI